MVGVYQQNPGSVHVRFGRSMEAYEEAVFVGNLEAASNALRVAQTQMEPWMTPKEILDYEAMPGYAVGDKRSREKVLDDMEKRRRVLLEVSRKPGVYAKAKEEWGDASTLEDPIPEATA